MNTYLITHNFDACRPARWLGTDYARRFGPENTGFVIAADSRKEAGEILRAGYHLNPYYLTIALR